MLQCLFFQIAQFGRNLYLPMYFVWIIFYDCEIFQMVQYQNHNFHNIHIRCFFFPKGTYSRGKGYIYVYSLGLKSTKYTTV